MEEKEKIVPVYDMGKLSDKTNFEGGVKLCKVSLPFRRWKTW